MSTTAAYALAISKAKTIEEFNVQELIESLQKGRMIHSGKECEATWFRANEGKVLDEKAKAELTKALNESTVVITERNEGRGGPTVTASHSSTGNMSEAEKNQFLSPLLTQQFAKMAQAAAMAANQISYDEITFLDMTTATQWTLRIAALSPQQAPILNAGSAAGAAAAATTAASPAKK